jgi:flagellar biosynthesis/type III secretory pathway M-ring protein FliF/YscJ
LLKPGAKVAEIEAAMDRAALPGRAGAAAMPALPGIDPNLQIRDRARELAAVDPQKAAHLLRAWINVDTDKEDAKRA